MFRIISQRKFNQIIRDERHKGFTLGYQLAQSERTKKGFIYGSKGIEFEKSNPLTSEIDEIIKNTGF